MDSFWESNDKALYFWWPSGSSIAEIENSITPLSDALFADGIVFSFLEVLPFGGGVKVYGTCGGDVEKRIRTHFETILKERKNP